MAFSHFSSHFAHSHPVSAPLLAPCRFQNTCRCCFSLAFPRLLPHQGDCLMQRAGRAPHRALAKTCPLPRDVHGCKISSAETGRTDPTSQKFSLFFWDIKVATFSAYSVLEQSCIQLMKVLGAVQRRVRFRAREIIYHCNLPHLPCTK